MYAILIAISLAIYSMILVDFSPLFHEFSVQSDLLASTQALYSAEGKMEQTWQAIYTGEIAERNTLFLDEKSTSPSNSSEEFLTYNQGAWSSYAQNILNPKGEDLNAALAFYPHQKTVSEGIYLAEGQSLDRLAYYGLEASSEKTFIFRQVDLQDNFNELILSYNQNGESEGLVVDLFKFPREENGVSFLSFEELEAGLEGGVQRRVINTQDSSQNGTLLDFNDHLLSIHFAGQDGNYKDTLRLSGFQPTAYNYLIRFQTLQNQPIHFKLAASYQSQPVPLPNMNQTLDVIGVAQSGVYQRLKMQRQTEEGLMPGLGFVHFSDEVVHK